MTVLLNTTNTTNPANTTKEYYKNQILQTKLETQISKKEKESQITNESMPLDLTVI